MKVLKIQILIAQTLRLQVKHLESQQLNCTVLEIVDYLKNYSSIVNNVYCVLFSSDVSKNVLFVAGLLLTVTLIEKGGLNQQKNTQLPYSKKFLWSQFKFFF